MHDKLRIFTVLKYAKFYLINNILAASLSSFLKKKQKYVRKTILLPKKFCNLMKSGISYNTGVAIYSCITSKVRN